MILFMNSHQDDSNPSNQFKIISYNQLLKKFNAIKNSENYLFEQSRFSFYSTFTDFKLVLKAGHHSHTRNWNGSSYIYNH